MLNWLFSGNGFASGTHDLLELRLIIEPATARLAAQRATAEHLAAIKGTLESMQASVADSESSVEPDLQFHLAILEATENAFMRPFGALIQEALRASFKLANRDRPAALICTKTCTFVVFCRFLAAGSELLIEYFLHSTIILMGLRTA